MIEQQNERLKELSEELEGAGASNLTLDQLIDALVDRLNEKRRSALRCAAITTVSE